MFPLQSRRQYGHLGAVRSEKPIKSGNNNSSDIFYDPEGVLAAPGAEGNIPAKFLSNLDVHMEDWECNKEQIAPVLPGAKKEDVCRVYLKPRRPSSKKAARALLEMSVDAMNSPGGPNMSLKGATVGKPSVSKIFTPAVTTDNVNSGSGIFRVPAVPVKHVGKATVAGAGASIDLKKKDKIFAKIQTPASSDESKVVSEAEGKQKEDDEEEEEEGKENEPPCSFLLGVNPNHDKGFAPESPFGSDLPHLLTPYAQDPILANDPSSKLRAPISVSEAMVISKGKELGSVPFIREGVLGEFSPEHLYLTEPRGLVYIPSAGLQYRHNSSENFVPTMTTESGLKDMTKALSKFDAFEIWQDEDETSESARRIKAGAGDVHGRGAHEIGEEKGRDGDDGDKDPIDKDDYVYEKLLKLHFGDGWNENIAKYPSSGNILVRSQSSANLRNSYDNITESRSIMEGNAGSFFPPKKIRILHRSPGTDREVFDNWTGTVTVKSAGNVGAGVRRSKIMEDDNDENASPPIGMDPLAVVRSDEKDAALGFTSISLHALSNGNCLSAGNSKEKTLEILPQNSPPSVAFPYFPSVVSPALSPLAVHSPLNQNILGATMANSTDTPSMTRPPASLKRANSFRDFRESKSPIQTQQDDREFPQDRDDDDPSGSLQSGSPHAPGGTNTTKPENACGHDNVDLPELSQLDLFCHQAPNPTVHTTVNNSPAARSEMGTIQTQSTESSPISSPTGTNAFTKCQ